MGNLNYDIDDVIRYIQSLDPITAGIIQARAQARLSALSLARATSQFAIVPRTRGQGGPAGSGNVQSVLNVIDSLIVSDGDDLRRIEAVAQRFSELDDEESSSSQSELSSQSTSSSSVTSSSSGSSVTSSSSSASDSHSSNSSSSLSYSSQSAV
jgi:hypothetical protein